MRIVQHSLARPIWKYLPSFIQHLRVLVPFLLISFVGRAVAQQPLHQADPTIFLHDHTYYLFGTNDQGSNEGFLVYSSPDLVAWKLEGPALSKSDAFGEAGFWAPQVWAHQGKFYMAYTANEQIAIAVSDHPAGPYKQSDHRPLASAQRQIDPFVFVDEDGAVYFYHVRLQEGNRIFVGKMDDGFSAVDPATLKECLSVIPSTWEDAASTEWKVAEGPTVIKRGKHYYLFYSANDFRHPGYAVGYAVSDSPTGPWRRHADKPIINSKRTGHPGSGHGDVFEGKDGQLYYVFHTHYSDDSVAPRKTAIVRLSAELSPSGETLFSMDAGSFRFLNYQGP